MGLLTETVVDSGLDAGICGNLNGILLEVGNLIMWSVVRPFELTNEDVVGMVVFETVGEAIGLAVKDKDTGDINDVVPRVGVVELEDVGVSKEFKVELVTVVGAVEAAVEFKVFDNIPEKPLVETLADDTSVEGFTTLAVEDEAFVSFAFLSESLSSVPNEEGAVIDVGLDMLSEDKELLVDLNKK